MQLLVAKTESAIRELEARACEYVNTNQLARCSSWSAIYTNGKWFGPKFGFLWSSQLAPAFTDEELGVKVDENNAVSYANVIEADPEEWTVVEPPAPPTPDAA